MAGYQVKTDVFEGPFDLLLSLVAKQKVEVTDLSISDIADQYLEYVEGMRDLDLDVASDFLLVAATLLEIKAASLLPQTVDQDLQDLFEDLTPEEARDLLVARLLTYKQFKSVAFELNARMEAESRMHPRAAGMPEEFLKIMPDYLEGMTLRSLAVICADLMHKREVFLLEAEHVAAMPISLELHTEGVLRTLERKGRAMFSELLRAGANHEEIVVTFLAILELYKRGQVDIRQSAIFGDIEVSRLPRRKVS